jgi:gamma-glutamyl-gamma-aminobutyrate hydrolase PuuD
VRRLRIAISQRRDAVDGRGEERDGLDVRLPSLLWALGFLPLPLVSGVRDPAGYLAGLAPDGVLLSGGNDIGSALARDALEHAALDHALVHGLPVLGICRGMQFINHYQGGALRPVAGHTAVRHLVSGPLLVGDAGREVNSYHDHGLLDADLGTDLQAIAWAADGVVEAIRHCRLPWLGIMWHPERDEPLNEADLELIYDHFLEKP